MNASYKYKQTFGTKLVVLALFALFPVASNRPDYYASVPYYAALAAAQAALVIYGFSKTLMLTRNGIEKRVLWVVPTALLKWETIIEARETTGLVELSTAPGASGGTVAFLKNPFLALKWFAAKYEGRMIKFTILNEQAPIFLQPRTIKNADELIEKLKEKVHFIQIQPPAQADAGEAEPKS